MDNLKMAFSTSYHECCVTKLETRSKNETNRKKGNKLHCVALPGRDGKKGEAKRMEERAGKEKKNTKEG